MSVYNPQGGGNVHTDRVISGGRKVAKGMGFKAAAKSVAKKQGLPMKQANAIIGAGKANASAKAKKANPNLLKTGNGKPAKKTAKKMAERATDMVTGGKGSSKPMAGKPMKQASARQRGQAAVMSARAGKVNMPRSSGGGSAAAC